MFVFNALTVLLAIASNPAFVTVVQATPLTRRDVIAPKILTPTAGTVWTIGEVESVTWDTSNFPPDSRITNPNGQIILGHQGNDSLNLDFDHPLAKDFKLRDGSVQLTVPDVPPRDDYIVVLYGDSGNTSPAFTITKITRASSPSSSSSLVSPSLPSSDVTPPQTPVSSSSSSVVVPASSPPAVAQASSLPHSTSSSSSPYSSVSSSPSSPSTVPATSSATSFLSAYKSNLMVLTSCMASAIFFHII